MVEWLIALLDHDTHYNVRSWRMVEKQYLVDAMTMNESWRLFKILAEFVDGFEALADVYPCVSIFGSARVRPGDDTYEKTLEIARKLGQHGYHIITGGGPGIMEAGNKGAKEGGVKSIGLSIQLPLEQETNSYVELDLNFQYFFVRKVMFIKYAQAYVGMPGGLGTLDEIFEALTLIQTKRIRPFPVILVGREYWGSLWNWIRDTLLKQELISPEDMDLVRIVDEPDEVVRIIKQTVVV